MLPLPSPLRSKAIMVLWDQLVIGSSSQTLILIAKENKERKQRKKEEEAVCPRFRIELFALSKDLIKTTANLGGYFY
nr:hypothetical protein CFP56_05749 [Quercus suber]